MWNNGNLLKFTKPFCPPPSPFVCLFIRLIHSGFPTLIPESNHIGSCFWPNDRSYQDLAWDCLSTSFTYIWLGYNIFSVFGIGFWTFIPEPNHIGSCFWHNDRYYQDLAWDCLSTSFTYIWLGYYLFSVIGIGFQTLITEPNYIGYCCCAQW